MTTPQRHSRSARVRSTIDATAGVAMTTAAVLLIWRLATIEPPPPPPPEPVPPEPVAVGGLPMAGDAQAPVGIILYSDFECPYCGTFARETLPALRQQYLDTGKAFLVFAHFPLPSLHPGAVQAAMLATCAQDAGRFWPLHDALFAVPGGRIDEPALVHAVAMSGLPPTALADCRATDALDRVKRMASEA